MNNTADQVPDETDYRKTNSRFAEALASKENRFVKFEDRKQEGVLTLDTIKTLCYGKYATTWKGVELMKDAVTMVIMQQLLWDVKPATIIEMGTYSGGSALWMADMMTSYGCKCCVYTVDIDTSNVHPTMKERKENIVVIQGDCFKVEEALPPEKLKSLPHPWVVVEDAHVNLSGVLDYLDRFMTSGDYLCVEDTNPMCPAIAGQGCFEDLGYTQSGPKKLNDLVEFMESHSMKYRVDTRFNDMFGYNATINLNGFLRRI